MSSWEIFFWFLIEPANKEYALQYVRTYFLKRNPRISKKKILKQILKFI